MAVAQLAVDQSVVLLILSLILGAFMVASLGWRLIVPEKKHVAKEEPADKEEGAARGLHKVLVAYLEESRKSTPRSTFQASSAQRSVEDLSTDLRDLSELLQINNSSTATVSVTPSSLSTDLTVIISLLAQVANVFVLVTLSDAEASLEDSKVQSLVQQQLRTVPVHRILLCKTTAGKIALVRQLSPSLHVDGDAAVARSLVKHVRSVVVINEELAAAAERSWITLPNGGEPPSDAVYVTADGMVLIDVPPSLLAVDLRPEALANLPRVAV